jgi:hypothetical protein
MQNIITQTIRACAAATVLAFVAGCQTDNQNSASSAVSTPEPSIAAAAPESAPPALTAGADGEYRVKAGSSEPFKDSAGHVWQAEVGFNGGDVIDRDPGTVIANTKDAGLFLSEHYGMDSFLCRVPNGKYLARLYFAETFDGITGPGQRVFSFNVQGREFKDFDIWVKAGGANRAYIETVPVEVTNGEFRIAFTAQVENPAINAIEIIPQALAGASDAVTSAPVAPVTPAAPVLVAPVVSAPLPTGPTAPAVLQIEASQMSGKVSPTFFGLMTEEINFSYEGGLYGELIRNRSFKADAVVPSVKPDTYEVVS